MNGFDVTLLVLLGVLVVFGLFKGLVRILVGLLALVTAFLVASHFHRPLADRLGTVDVAPELLRLSAYLLLFVAVLLAGGVLGWFLRKVLRAAMLGWADRLAGAALGLAAAVLAAALVVLPLVAYAPGGREWVASSRLAPYVVVVADLATSVVPRELAEAYRGHVDGLRRMWGGLAVDPGVSPEPVGKAGRT